VLLLSCGGGGDTGEPDLCLGGGGTSLVIGFGVGGEFHAYSEGALVGLEVAPQGGFGVPVRLKSTGLRVRANASDTANPDAPYTSVNVVLDTYIDGVLSASFLNDTAVAYCQADGTGLMWDLVVGFDAEKYTNSNLIDLHGAAAELVVVVTDTDGNVATSSVSVQISLEE
jgi:hypothetical protein